MRAVANGSILARYRIETCLRLEQIAETIAGEQSLDTFLPVPNETKELKAGSCVNVTQITVHDFANAPGLLGVHMPLGSTGLQKYQRAERSRSHNHNYRKPRQRNRIMTL
jgi:hypothetical protein